MKLNLTKQDIVDAQKRLGEKVHWTSLYPSRTLTDVAGCRVYLKSENLQKTGSFKVRGAYNKIAKLCEKGALPSSVIAASAGNHAQGVAYAASEKGISSTIVMPKGTPIAKVSATEGYGAKIVLHGDYYDDAYKYAREKAIKENAEFIHPFDDEDVIAGQGTIANEILKDKPDVDTILVPAGGGGLLAGVAFAAKQINHKIKVIGVQAEKADSIKQSFVKKTRITRENIFTIADGIAVKAPGEITTQYILKYADDVFSVSDDEIAETIIHLLERNKFAVEPAGAVTAALLLKGKLPAKNCKKIACVLSGGNIDVGFIHKIIQKGLVSRGRHRQVSVVLADKPGALESFAKVVGDAGANIISMQYDRTSTELALNETILHIAFEAAGREHGDEVIGKIRKVGFKLDVDC